MHCFASPLPPVGRARSNRTSRRRLRTSCSAVPRNLNEIVRVAAAGLDRAAAKGTARLQIDALVPGLNPTLEDSFPYNERLLVMLVRALLTQSTALRDSARVALLFKSEGTAASARQVYKKEGDLPANATIASYYLRDGDGESRLAGTDGFNVIINPVNARGNPVIVDVMRLVEQQPEAGWVMLNPDFSADRSALGMKDVKHRQEFLDTFQSVFYFRNLVSACSLFLRERETGCDSDELTGGGYYAAKFVIKRPKLIAVEKGALLYCFGDDWSVFRFEKDSYEEVATFASRPTQMEFSNAIESAPRERAPPQPANDKEYLTTVGVLAAGVAGLLYFFNSYPL